MDKGDSCNTRLWRMSNHIGTHIDCPRHFSREGDTLDAYPASFWLFSRTAVIDMIQVESGQILTVKDLDLSRVPSDVELLLIKTGFCDLRDTAVYWQSNPGFHPELAPTLRRYFPKLRVIGFDSISLTSFTHRSIGREAHKSFLDHSRPILIMEDMDLAEIDNNSLVWQVMIAPIRVKDADAAPCTVLAEVMK